MIEQYVERLSRDLELEEPLKPQMPGVYCIVLDEDIKITIVSSSSDQFKFSCTLGSCPSVRKEEFFTTLLLANLFGQGTRGALLGLDSEGAQVTLSLDVEHHIEYKEFRDIVEDFFNIVDFWRQELVNAASQ